MAGRQSTLPHLQTPSFSEAPLLSEQVAAWLQVLEEDLQTSPAPGQQSTGPHLHTSSFTAMPLPYKHSAAWLQALEEDAQTSPVADVQVPEAPQAQGARLAAVPFVVAHNG